MKNNNNLPNDTDKLRQQAEKIARSSDNTETMTPEETQKVFHELRVHQIELEMQNEELRRAKTELDTTRTRYFNLYDLAPVGYLTLTEKGLILEANLTTAGLFGIARSDLHKQPFFQFILKEDQDIFYLHRKQILETGKPKVCDLRMVKKDGTSFWAHLACSAVQDSNGATEYRIVMMDITDRKQVEEKITVSQKLLQRIIDLLPIRIFWKDKNLIYLGCNEMFAKDAGHNSTEDLIGKDDFQMVWKEQAILYQDDDRSVIESGKPKVNYEEQQTTPDGSKILLKTNKVPLIDLQGNTIGILGTYEDITERKRAELEMAKLESQLQQSQKIESVGRLAGGIAHDFNNMLTVILGHSEIALNQMDPKHPLYTDLTEIQKAAERSAELTRQLLAFARKQTVAPKVLDLNETVASMLNMLQRLIGEDLDLLWQPAKTLWPVKIDPSQIDQLLANLCVNARDAIKDVGKITIETQNSTFDQDYCTDHPGFIPGEYVSLAISDNGCGMDKETLSQIFEPFFTTREMGKGTGLGLATVYGIVRQNNGFINVYSEPGQGTTFNIYLPRYEGTVVSVQTESPVIPNQRGQETILLVEDEPAILKLTTRMLKGQGYTILATNSPKEAIRIAQEHAGEISLLMTESSCRK